MNGATLRAGIWGSCGCKKLENHSLVGFKFARLSVIRRDTGRGLGFWICKCDCGNQVSVSRGNLTSGNTKSCSCYEREKFLARIRKHGAYANPAMKRSYRVWAAMIQRCTNKNLVLYKNYGGRGIKVCPEWRRSFALFWKDMGERPFGKSLGRINNDGNYEPGNCQWETILQQASNRRNNTPITYNGETLIINEWARRTGMSRSMISMRNRRGWSPEKIFTTPPKVQSRES